MADQPNKSFHKDHNKRFSLLVIGSETKLFQDNSEARQRVLGYAPFFTELYVIVFTKTKNEFPVKSFFISPNIHLYPTCSRSSFAYIWDAWRLARNLPPVEGISAQDPFESGLAAYLINLNQRATLQLQIHTDFLNPYFVRESFLNWIRVKILARFLLPRADSLRVVSQRIKNSLTSQLQIPNAKINTLPVFVDVERIREAPITTDLHKKYPRFNKIILMASRLTKEKNVGLAFKAMPGILARDSNVGLVIVGAGPELKSLKSKALSYGLGHNIAFEPWTDDLPSYYKTADLFLNTSLYEGYGRTMVEALAAGCPVVSTEVGIAGDPNYKGIVIADQTNLGQIVFKLLSSRPDINLSLPYKGRLDYLRLYKSLWLN